MRITVLGGCGAWPTAGQGCSGYLVEHGGFRVLIDPGYATFPVLLKHCPAEAVDAVVVSHGHPDHCADLNPLLRARRLSDDPPAPLPVYAPHGALDAVLALDAPAMLASAYTLHAFEPGEGFGVGPFAARTWALPHFVPNAGIRLTAPGGAVLAYTGDTGPDAALLELARDADLFLCEATYLRSMDDSQRPYLMTARLAGEFAARARVARLLLTHLWPGTDPAEARAVAAEACGPDVPVGVARPGLTTDLTTPGGEMST
jgi:ribonuclease BN (tRNA processing enzyme)